MKKKIDRSYLLSLILALALALTLGGIIMALAGHNPFRAYAELAKERSATIRKVSCIGWGILDGKGQLLPCTPGSSIIPLQDGTVHFSVEIPSESVVPWQDSYQLLLEVATVDVDLAGNEIDGTRQSADWIVTLVPEKAE